MNKDQIKGRTKEMTGSIKEGVGRATDSPDTEAKGMAEKAAGKIQKNFGDAKEDLKDSTKKRP